MKRSIRTILKHLPLLGRLYAARETLRRLRPGHYSSPIPSLEDVRSNEARLFDRAARELPGIDLDVEGQLQLLNHLSKFYPDQPFSEEPTEGRRYFFRNGFYGHADALFLYGMIRHVRPKRIIEIGSGFSSFVMLDTNDLFFQGDIQLTFIEPHDERLRSRLKEEDRKSVEIISKPVQEVPSDSFDTLRAGDILFVDSSHVAKIGSDVNHILFEILPRIGKGVYVHFHDVFFPFEYPKEWIQGGRYWNEDYFLRAFLLFNSAFKIVIWNQYLGLHHAAELEARMPLCLQNTGGSLWLQRK